MRADDFSASRHSRGGGRIEREGEAIRIGFLQNIFDAHQRSAGTDAGDEALRPFAESRQLSQDFFSGSRVVGGTVFRVGELMRQEGAFGFAHPISEGN